MTNLLLFLTTLLNLWQMQPATQATGVIAGQVLGQDTGVPLAAVRVDLQRGNDFGLIQSVVTDDTGFYTFTDVVSGTYVIRFFPAPATGYIETYYPGKLNVATAELITVRAGENLQLNVQIVRGATITGRISASDGKPLGESVLGSASNAAALMYYRAQVDAAGVYTLTALPPATYDLSFSGGNFGWYQPYSRQIMLRSGEVVQNLDAVLRLGGKIQGQLTLDRPWVTGSELQILVYDEQKRQVGRGWASSGSFEVGVYSEEPVRLLFYPTSDMANVIPEYYRDQTTFNAATPLSVKPGEILQIINTELATRITSRQAATAPGLADVIALDYTNAYTLSFTLDRGATWQTVPTTPWFAEHNQLPETLTVVPKNDPNQPIRLLVSTRDTLYRSGDGGFTWATHTFPPTAPCNQPGNAQIDRIVRNPLNATQLYAEVVCLFEDGIFVPLSGGDNVAELRPAFHLFTSVDGGVTWQYLRTGVQIIPSPTVATRIYVFDAGWEQSDDNGTSWLKREFKAEGWGLNTLVPAAFDPNWLYALAGDGKGWNSQDNGKSWQQWPQNPCDKVLQLLSPPGPAHLLLARCASGLYRSIDDGETWVTLSSESGGAILADYGQPGGIFWVRDSGLWTSADQGTSWRTLLATEPPAFQFPNTLFLPTVSQPE